jgi:hypothetical protein
MVVDPLWILCPFANFLCPFVSKLTVQSSSGVLNSLFNAYLFLYHPLYLYLILLVCHDIRCRFPFMATCCLYDLSLMLFKHRFLPFISFNDQVIMFCVFILCVPNYRIVPCSVCLICVVFFHASAQHFIFLHRSCHCISLTLIVTSNFSYFSFVFIFSFSTFYLFFYFFLLFLFIFPTIIHYYNKKVLA